MFVALSLISYRRGYRTIWQATAKNTTGYDGPYEYWANMATKLALVHPTLLHLLPAGTSFSSSWATLLWKKSVQAKFRQYLDQNPLNLTVMTLILKELNRNDRHNFLKLRFSVPPPPTKKGNIYANVLVKKFHFRQTPHLTHTHIQLWRCVSEAGVALLRPVFTAPMNDRDQTCHVNANRAAHFTAPPVSDPRSRWNDAHRGSRERNVTPSHDSTVLGYVI